MSRTLKIGGIRFDNEDDKSYVQEYMVQYNHVYRRAFNKFFNGQTTSQLSLAKQLNHIDLLDSWWIQSAITDAKTAVKSLKKSNPDIEKVVFGGRKNFIRLCKGKMDKDTWKMNTYVPLSSIGEKASGSKQLKGNRKFKILSDLQTVTILVKGKKINVHLPKLRDNAKRIITSLYKHQEQKDLPITYKISNDYLYIVYDEDIFATAEPVQQKKNRIFAVDLNPNYIGWSVVDWYAEDQFKVIDSGVYSIKQINDAENALQGYSSSHKSRKYFNNKRHHETIEICNQLINKALHYQCSTFSMESLNIKRKDHEQGKYRNRLINNQWVRNLCQDQLKKRCILFRIKCLEVKANYSSFAGNMLFKSFDMPDMVLSSIEIGRRAYEYNAQYIEKTKQIKKNIIQPDLNCKYYNILITKSLEEFGIKYEQQPIINLYNTIKDMKLMYRVSVENYFKQFFRLKSDKTFVQQLHLKHRKNDKSL